MEVRATGAALLALVTAACSGSGGEPSTPTSTNLSPLPPRPPISRAELHVEGNGAVVIHPSTSDEFAAVIEFPLRIQETGGGTAIWDFFRVSYFVNGVETERNEKGATDIEALGFRNVGANSNMTPTMVTPTNDAFWSAILNQRPVALDEGHVVIRLGFTDSGDGRTLERTLGLLSFEGFVLKPLELQPP